MGLRVNLDVPNIFEYLVRTYDELRIARDELLRPNREPTQDEKIELGRLFQNILESARDEHVETVSKSLPHAALRSRGTSAGMSVKS